MLEFGGEITFEVVLDEEDAEKVGVASSAEDVPREGSETERSEGSGMKEPKSIAPAFGEERPEENGAPGEDDGSGAFGENGKAEKESEEEESEPRCSRENGRMFGAGEADDGGGADHGDGQHGAERHIRGGGVGETDHANGCGQEQEEPASCFRAVEAQREPSENERGQKGGYRAGQARGGFTNTKEFEAEGGPPVVEWRLFKPRLAIEVRSDPVAGLGHVARDPSVSRLVRADKANGAKVAEVADVQRRDEENDPSASYWKTSACRMVENGRSRVHGLRV